MTFSYHFRAFNYFSAFFGVSDALGGAWGFLDGFLSLRGWNLQPLGSILQPPEPFFAYPSETFLEKPLFSTRDLPNLWEHRGGAFELVC